MIMETLEINLFVEGVTLSELWPKPPKKIMK